jgi:hypothetical protein
MFVARAGSVVSCLLLIACGGGGSKPQERIRSVNVVGTVVDGSLYTGGRMQVLVVPFDVRGEPVLDTVPRVAARVVSPSGLSASVVSATCAANRERQPLATGIAVDDSTSMLSNDPDDASGFAPGRKAAVRRVLDAMAPADVVLLADFSGSSATPLRDLVCAAAEPAAACVASDASFTTDRNLLSGAVDGLRTVLGTPLYAACQQLVALVAGRPSMRHAMVVLSDGLPDGDDSARAQCLAAARSAGMTLNTIGFGAAAEGPSVACSAGCPVGWSCASDRCTYDTSAVRAMRELSEATGGSYAPASDPARVTELLDHMAFSAGECTVTVALSGQGALATGDPVRLELTVNGSAAVSFSFLAPAPLAQ